MFISTELCFLNRGIDLKMCRFGIFSFHSHALNKIQERCFVLYGRSPCGASSHPGHHGCFYLSEIGIKSS